MRLNKTTRQGNTLTLPSRKVLRQTVEVLCNANLLRSLFNLTFLVYREL